MLQLLSVQFVLMHHFLSQVDQSHVNSLLDTIQSFLLGQNTQSVRLSADHLKNSLKQPKTFRSLAYILTYATDLNILQMTGVLLSRVIVKSFAELDVEEQRSFEEILLGRYEVVEERRLEKILAGLVGEVLGLVRVEGWPKFKEVVLKMEKANPEKALLLLEYTLGSFEPPPELLTYIFESLKYCERVTSSLSCLQTVVDSHEVIDDQFLDRLVENEYTFWSEDNMIQLLDILSAVAKKSGELKPKFASWVCKNIVGNKGLSERVRASGVDFLFIASKKQESLLSKKNFMKDMIQAACDACAQNAGPSNQDSKLLQDVALYLLQARITKVTNKQVFPTLWGTISKLINSDIPKKMCTGFIVMTGISQTCTDQMRSKLSTSIMNKWIPKALNHPEQEVRMSAIRCLGYLCEFLESDIIDYRDLIITAMVKEVGHLDQKTAEIAMVALELLFYKMIKEEIQPYLSSATHMLVGVVNNPNSTVTTKKIALSALCSLISTAEQSFTPYVPLVLPISLTLLSTPIKPQQTPLHASNITLQGHLISVFCSTTSPIRKDYYIQYVQPNLGLIHTLLNKSTQYPEIMQSCFCYYYKLATAIQDEFAPIFDQIIDKVIEVCEAQIATKEVEQEEDGILSLDSESQVVEGVQIAVVEVDLKAAAMHTLGDLANACPNKFSPYMDKTIEIMDNLKHFCVDTIRTQVIDCYTKVTRGIIRSHFGGQIPPYQQGLPCQQRLPQNIEEYFNQQLIPIFLQFINDDFSFQVKMYAFECLDELTKSVGPVLVDKKLPEITEAIKSFIEKGHDMEDEEEMEIEEEEEENILESVGELVRRLAKVLREGFLPYLHILVPIMIEQIKHKEDSMEMSVQMTGSLAKCFEYLPQLITTYGSTLVPRLHELRTVNHERLNRNISYCLGIMFEYNVSFMASYLEVSTHTLQDIFQMSAVASTKQNALSGMCRIICALNPNIPKDNLIKTVIEAMPFTGDPLQERTALKFVVFISKTSLPSIKHYFPRIYQILKLDLATPQKYKIKDPLLTDLRQLCQYIQSVHGMYYT